jgi:hypothetical protein
MSSDEVWTEDVLYEGPLFGLTVARYGWSLSESAPYDVTLPHQCDAWTFTDYQDGGDFTNRPVEALEALIAEATEALRVLVLRIGDTDG